MSALPFTPPDFGEPVAIVPKYENPDAPGQHYLIVSRIEGEGPEKAGMILAQTTHLISAERIAACVNAFQGIADPAAFTKQAQIDFTELKAWRIGKRRIPNSGLDEALNSGDGVYRP